MARRPTADERSQRVILSAVEGVYEGEFHARALLAGDPIQKFENGFVEGSPMVRTAQLSCSGDNSIDLIELRYDASQSSWVKSTQSPSDLYLGPLMGAIYGDLGDEKDIEINWRVLAPSRYLQYQAHTQEQFVAKYKEKFDGFSWPDASFWECD